MNMEKTSTAPLSELQKCVAAVDQISKFFGWIGAPLPFFCAFMITYEIIMRTIFEMPTVWAAELTAMMCATCYFLGGAWNIKTDGHIRVDVLYSLMPPRLRAGANCINFILMALYIVIMIKFIWAYMIQSIYLNESMHTLWDPYMWPLKIIMFIGFVMVLLQGLSNFCRDFYFLIKGRAL